MGSSSLVIRRKPEEEGEGRSYTLEEIYLSPRRTKCLTFSIKFLELIDEVRSLVHYEGKAKVIPLSDLLEDMAIFVMEDDDRLDQFLNEFYVPEEGEDEG